MTTIAEKDRPTIRDLLARELVEDVELVLFTGSQSTLAAPEHQNSGTCEETRELLEDLIGLSEQLHLTVHDVGADPVAATRYNVTVVPTVLIRRKSMAVGSGASGRAATAADPAAPATDANVRFLGMPGGYEFSTLLADVVDVSTGLTGLSAETRSRVQAIEAPVHIQVFVTPNCPYCPPAARIAHKLAMESPLILADVIEANEFLDLSDRYRVQTVPKTVINDRVEFVGALTEARVIEAVMEAVRRGA